MILPPGMQYAFTSWSEVCTFTSHCHCGRIGTEHAGLRNEPLRDPPARARYIALFVFRAPCCARLLHFLSYASCAPISISFSDTSIICLRSTPTAPGCVVCTV